MEGTAEIFLYEGMGWKTIRECHCRPTLMRNMCEYGSWRQCRKLWNLHTLFQHICYKVRKEDMGLVHYVIMEIHILKTKKKGFQKCMSRIQLLVFKITQTSTFPLEIGKNRKFAYNLNIFLFTCAGLSMDNQFVHQNPNGKSICELKCNV